MANHQDRLARRQRANDELQARLAARNVAFDALDALDVALGAVATTASAVGDPLTRAERVRSAVAKVETAIDGLRARAEELRTSEHAKASEIAELLGVPAAKLIPRRPSVALAPSVSLGLVEELPGMAAPTGDRLPAG